MLEPRIHRFQGCAEARWCEKLGNDLAPLAVRCTFGRGGMQVVHTALFDTGAERSQVGAQWLGTGAFECTGEHITMSTRNGKFEAELVRCALDLFADDGDSLESEATVGLVVADDWYFGFLVELGARVLMKHFLFAFWPGDDKTLQFLFGTAA